MKVYANSMLYSQRESLDDRIARYVLEKPCTAKEIQEKFLKERLRLTVQGIYKILRSLMREEVIIKQGKVYTLSEEWRKRVVSKLGKLERQYELSDGERISLELNSLVHLDQQWKNVMLELHEIDPTMPGFYYNAHEIWIHLSDSRRDSETEYLTSFTKQKIYSYYLLGGNTSHDLAIKKQLQSKYLQFSIGKVLFPATDYPVILGDYIITTRISAKLAEDIEKVYQTSRDTESLETKLRAIGIEKKKIRLIVECNREKAKRLRKKLSEDFHVPKELRERF